MYKDLLKKVRDEFSGIELDYKKEIDKVAPHLDAKYLALLETKDLAIELLVAKTHQYDKLVEKVKEFFVAYHAEETEAGEYDEDGFPKTNGLELDEKFKVIAEELKAMVDYKNENE